MNGYGFILPDLSESTTSSETKNVVTNHVPKQDIQVLSDSAKILFILVSLCLNFNIVQTRKFAGLLYKLNNTL